MSRVSTVYLLTCAAIGVAGGILLWGATAASTLLFAVLPIVSVAFAGFWLIPAVVALRLLERPGAGVLVGLISGLVVLPYIGTSLWWAFFAELPFLIVGYRFWKTWQHYLGAVFIGILYPILAAVSFNLWTSPPWAQVMLFALTVASTVGGTALAILIGDRLRAAGVARLARRVPKAPSVSPT